MQVKVGSNKDSDDKFNIISTLLAVLSAASWGGTSALSAWFTLVDGSSGLMRMQ